MGNIAARAVVLLSLALAYSAGWQGGAAPTTKAGCAHHDNALRPGLMANLGPWIAASVSTNASTAEFALQHAPQHVFPFIVHAGVVRVLVPFGRTDQGRPFWMKPLLELAELAAADPSLSFEFLFSVDDQPTQPLPAPGEPFRYALPVWGYNQQEGYADFAAPHANTPDEMCAAAVEKDSPVAASWSSRRDAALGRYTLFCPPYKVYPVCPRIHFSRVASSPAGIAAGLDVGPTNFAESYNFTARVGDSTRPFVHPFASRAEWRYILVLDGFAASSKLASSLALGSVVLRQRSLYSDHWAAAMTPWETHVTIWTHGIDDVLPTLAWLRAHPSTATHIATMGRHFACTHLIKTGRACL